VRVVAALGGNALLKRGEPLTAENQRANARVACKALAPVALEHELVISHGNGPQVGLLALQGSAYEEVDPYPLDLLGAQTEGMIGYLIQQELGNELPYDKRLASLLTLIEVDRDDPAFGDPTKPIGPIYTEVEAKKLADEKGWLFKPDGDSFRRVVPSPLPQRIFGIEPVEWLLEHRSVVICAGGGGIPVMYKRRRRIRRLGNTRSACDPPRNSRGARRRRVCGRLDGTESPRRLLLRRADRGHRRDRLDVGHACTVARRGRNDRYARSGRAGNPHSSLKERWKRW
jgi:carbamate kinase